MLSGGSPKAAGLCRPPYGDGAVGTHSPKCQALGFLSPAHPGHVAQCPGTAHFLGDSGRPRECPGVGHVGV